jgi:FkbM family methyltransferase
MNQYTSYYRDLHKDGNIPQPHIDYLYAMRDTLQIQPRVIYDVGAAVLHWTKNAKQVWPAATIIAFDALAELDEFYANSGVASHIGVLSDTPGREVTYYAHPLHLGGNSYYKENVQWSPAAAEIYDEKSERKCFTDTLDRIVVGRKFPRPDMIKFDVQGAELDILRGMPNVLQHVQHMIVELQHVEYNIGAKQVQESIPFIEQLGFRLQSPRAVRPDSVDLYFCGNGPDADYHFVRNTQ